MTKFFAHRLHGRRLLEFAAGDYHAKYVQDSPFLSNPLLAKAKAAALKKTPGGVKYTPRNVSAEAQSAIDELKRGPHSREISKYEQGISPLAAIGRRWQKEGMIEHANPHVAEAYHEHEKGLREIKRKHQDEINRMIIEKGGGIHAKSYPPGWKVQGKDKLVPALHESWTNYAISVNDQAKHTEYLARKKVIKDAGETVAHAGVDKPYTEKKIPSYEVGGKFYPESVIREGGLEKGSKSKLTDLTTAHRREVLSNAGQWKGYKAELMGSRTRTRQALAEELGYKIMPGNKEGRRIQVTGKRQIIQAQRKMTGTLKPTRPEFWKELERSKHMNAPVDPYGKLPLGSRPNPPRYQTPVRKVGLAGAGPEEIAQYGHHLGKVEAALGTITKAHLEDRVSRANRLKENLQKKTDVNIGIANPKMDTPEVYSRREVAVNELLHGSATPPKEPSAAGKLIEGEQLARHASTIGISPGTARKVRTEYRNLADTSELAHKKIRKEALGTPGPFVMEPPPPPHVGPMYPHLKKLGIGLGIGAGAIGGAYLVHRLLKNRREKQEAKMSSRLKLIQFVVKPTKDQRTIVAKDRYIKNIKNQDLADAIANYSKSAAAGAGLGYLLRKRGGMPLGRALKIGAAGGLVAQAGTRAITSGSKDPFGERSWKAKYVDQAPAIAGTAVGAGILLKRHTPKIWHTLTQFSATDPDKNRPYHDIATGTIEGAAGVLATDRLIKRFAPSGAGVGRKLVIGGVVGGAATGGIGFMLNRLVEKKIAERRAQKQQMSSRIRLIQFALSEEEKEQNRQVRRWSGRSLKTRGEELYQWGGRAGRAARDIKNTVTGQPALDSRGRPRKKEWEKPWVWKAAATTAIGLGLTGVGLYKTKTGQSILTKLSNNPVGKFFGGVRDEMSQLRRRAGGPTVSEALKVKKVEEIESAKKAKEHRQQLKDITGMKSRLRTIQFAENLDYWDARDLSRNQAVVTAPGGQRRHRREKTFTERKAVRDALFTAGLAVAGAGGYGAHAWRTRYKAGLPVIGGSLVHAPEQLSLPLFKKSKPPSASQWVHGHLDPAFRLASRLRLVRFEEKKRDYATPAVGAASGVGGFVAGGMYRGRDIQPGEDLTGRRITRPHNIHPLLQHEGIGVTGGKIAHMHYTKDMGRDAIVKEVTPEEFSGGKTLKVLDKEVSHEAAKRARSMVGSKTPYSMFYNNCQRFGICARTGKTHFIPRQLKAALAVGGIAAGVGGGVTKGVQIYRNRKSQHNFAAQDDNGGHPWVRRSAEAAGLGIAGLGLATFPGARRMMSISARELVGRARTRLSKTKTLGGIIKAPAVDPNKGGKMVYDYIDASQRFLNRGASGKLTGKVLQAGVAKPDSFVGRVANKVYPGDFGPGHFARFRASPLEALKHWDYEHGEMLTHRMKPKVHPTTGVVTPMRTKAIGEFTKMQHRQHAGRDAVWSELNDALHNKGMNEEEALHHVTHNTQNPVVRDYMNLLAGSKEKAAKKYAKLGTISPGLMAVGAGTTGTAYAIGKRKDDNR